jgi:O-antigen ligase
MTSTMPPSALRSASAWLPGAVSLGLIAAVAAMAGGPSWALALILGVFGTVVAVLAPGVLLATYLLLAFYKSAVQVYSPIDVTVLLALLTSAQIVPVLLGLTPRVSRAGIVLWLALTALILAGVLYAPDQDRALSSAANWCALVFVPLLAGGLRVGSDARYLRQFLWSFMAMGVLTLMLGLLSLSGTQRLAVLGENTIQAGRAALLVPLIGVAFVMRERGPLVRAVIVALIPVALVVALATGSRGPLLALSILALAGVVRFMSGPRSIDWRQVGLVLGLLLASGVVALLIVPDLPYSSLKRFASLGEFIQNAISGELSTTTGDTSSGTRVTLFRLAISMFGEQPILGFGTAGFPVISLRLLSLSEAEPWPHNALLQFAAEYGLVGLALFVGLVGLALTRRLPPGGTGGAVRVTLLFFLLNAMVSGDIFTDRLTWGLLMLLLLIDVPQAAPDGPPPAAGSEPPAPPPPTAPSPFAGAT